MKAGKKYGYKEVLARIKRYTQYINIVSNNTPSISEDG